MPASLSVNQLLELYGSTLDVDRRLKNRRTASTHVRRYTELPKLPCDAHTARTAHRRRHQLRLSGLGSLKGRGLGRF